MRFRWFAFFLCTVLYPASASALCTSFSVTATALDFGVYDPAAGTPVSATGTVAVRCGIGVLPAFAVVLSKGGGSYEQRTMTKGADRLDYNLYADAAHMMIWGDGTSGTIVQSLTGIITLGTTDYTVYGLIAAGQYPAPGAYGDTITVTVNF
jgi:spore coat protein U-like protein